MLGGSFEPSHHPELPSSTFLLMCKKKIRLGKALQSYLFYVQAKNNTNWLSNKGKFMGKGSGKKIKTKKTKKTVNK